MADQNLNVNLSVNSTQYVQGVSKAASGTVAVGTAADSASSSLTNMEQTAVSGATNITRAEKSIAIAINQIQNSASKTGSNFLIALAKCKLLFQSVQAVSNQLRVFADNLRNIGDSAEKLGTTPEYFQKLTDAAKQSGSDLQDVSTVFLNIQKTAKAALSGDSGATADLRRIGVTLDDLRDQSPEQVFEIVAGAISRMGDSAAEQQDKIAVCGEAVGNITDKLGELSRTSGRSMEGIFSNEAVAAAQSISESTESIQRSLLAIAQDTGILKLFEKFANQLKECAEEIAALKKKFKGELDTPQDQLWNNVMVDEENKRLAHEIDEQWLRDYVQKNGLTGTMKRAGISSKTPVDEISSHFLPWNLLPKDAEGMTPGMKAREFSRDNPHGFRSASAVIPIQSDELDAKRQEKREQERRKAEEEARRQEQAQADLDARLTELRKSPDESKREEIETKISQELAAYRERGVTDEKRLAELEKALREKLLPQEKGPTIEEPSTESPEERRLRSQNERLQAQLERMRQRNAQRFARTSQKSDDSIASERKHKSKHKKTHSKSLERTEAQPLSTAGSISDPKAARAQRQHELRLAREAAKQKITVKVRPVKGAVIRNAVSTAVGGSLKQLAAAVERLSLQTYIVK